VSSKSPAASASSNRQQQNFMIMAAIVVIAIIAAVVFIVLSNNRPGSTTDINKYASIPQSRTADGAFLLGHPEAPVTIVEFADFQCPHCQDYQETVNRFIDNYVVTGKAKFEFRFLPAIDNNSVFLFKLAECTETLKPGSFWPAHDVLFEMITARRFNRDTAPEFASRMGIEYADLLECTSDASQVETDMQVAEQIGAQGTPAVFVRFDDGPMQWIQGGPGNSAVYSYDVLAALVETSSG
jgi:protein-disulfide isomerase